MGFDEEVTIGDDRVFAELARSGGGLKSIKVQRDGLAEKLPIKEVYEEQTGQLTVDVFQDEDNIYVQSAIAGIGPDDLDVNITKESVTIRGRRARTHNVSERNFFYQECFWGSFSRSVVLPEEVDPDSSSAGFKNGVLTIQMPKLARRRSKNLRVRSDS